MRPGTGWCPRALTAWKSWDSRCMSISVDQRAERKLTKYPHHWPNVLLHLQLHSRQNGQKEKLTQYFLSLFCLPIQPCICPFQAGNLLGNIITGTPRTATICQLLEYLRSFFFFFFLRPEYYKDSSVKLLNKVGPENSTSLYFVSITKAIPLMSCDLS